MKLLLPFERIDMYGLKTYTKARFKKLEHVLVVESAAETVCVVVPAVWYFDIVEMLKAVQAIQER